MDLDLSKAVRYHDGQFPPDALDYGQLLPNLLSATEALARYDQMLQGLHNSEVFLAPLRSQEAVVSSRMEGTISTMDEILQLEAEYADDEDASTEFRWDAIETALYRRALNAAQEQLDEERPLSESLLRSIHQQLLSFGRGARKSPGHYKTAVPGLSVGSGVINGHFIFQVVIGFAGKALNHMQLVSMRCAFCINPHFLIKAHRIHNKRIPFPVTN